jgi:hypothetical protein
MQGFDGWSRLSPAKCRALMFVADHLPQNAGLRWLEQLISCKLEEIIDRSYVLRMRIYNSFQLIYLLTL